MKQSFTFVWYLLFRASCLTHQYLSPPSPSPVSPTISLFLVELEKSAEVLQDYGVLVGKVTVAISCVILQRRAQGSTDSQAFIMINIWTQLSESDSLHLMN